MRSLPVVLAARLLPVVVLAVAGWSMTSASGPTPAATPKAEAPAPKAPSAGAAAQSGSPGATTAGGSTPVAFSKPPAACAAIPAATISTLVPGAKTAGTALEASDPSRRTACSWNALKGFDYHWLDISFEITTTTDAAHSLYEKQAKSTTTALGPGADEASISDSLTTQAKQETREAVVVARTGNMLITVTYNGSDYATTGAPPAARVREGALTVAKAALSALK